MSDDPIKTLQNETALAIAALGLTFAKTLAVADSPPRILEDLKKQAIEMAHHLEDINAHQAAAMLGVFIRALSDPTFFPRK